jgi:hypothetical protein
VVKSPVILLADGETVQLVLPGGFGSWWFKSLQLCSVTGVSSDSRYIWIMIFRFAFLLAVTGWFLTGSPRVFAETDNPYASIVARNIFGLVPIPTNAPVDAVPATPPPKITPNGIMTLFGKLQVLFKVAAPPVPGQPPKDQSYVMGEGERQDDIEVQKIDEPSATITFNNHGTVQELALAAGAASTAGPASAPAAAFGAPLPGRLPNMSPAPGAGASMGGRFGRLREASAANSPGGNNFNPGYAPQNSSPSVNLPSFGGTGKYANTAPSEPALSPEAQVIMMEASRIATQDEVTHGHMPPLPPTPLTPPEATGVGGAPLVTTPTEPPVPQ